MDEVRDPIQLRCVGFCGADDTVDPAELKAISEQHGWVEWGVLFRPEKAGSPRFASDEWLKRLGEVNSAGRMRLAGHLCATHVDDLLRGDTSFVRKLHEVLRPPAGPSRHAHPKPPAASPARPPRRLACPCVYAAATAHSILPIPVLEPPPPSPTHPDDPPGPRPLTGLQRPAASPTLCSATYPEGLQACVAWPQAGFQRVQVNATAANGADVTLFADAPGAAACVEALQQATYPHFEPQPQPQP